MDKRVRDWLSSLRKMRASEADRAIRAKVEADASWHAALLAIEHSILPKREMIVLANDIMAGIGGLSHNHRHYLVLAERLGMRRFKALILNHLPSDDGHIRMLRNYLSWMARDLSSEESRDELREFLSSNF